MVGLIENNLHSVVEELERWQTIIGNHYLGYERNKSKI